MRARYSIVEFVSRAIESIKTSWGAFTFGGHAVPLTAHELTIRQQSCSFAGRDEIAVAQIIADLLTITMYAKGMSTRDITDALQEMYGRNLAEPPAGGALP